PGLVSFFGPVAPVWIDRAVVPLALEKVSVVDPVHPVGSGMNASPSPVTEPSSATGVLALALAPGKPIESEPPASESFGECHASGPVSVPELIVIPLFET